MAENREEPSTTTTNPDEAQPNPSEQNAEKPKLFQRRSSSISTSNVPRDYDPFEDDYRQTAPGSISALEGLEHLLKGSLGTGILAMGQAYSHIGTAMGFVMTFVLISILGHCIHICLKAQYIQCKKMGTPFIEYPDSMEAAFKNGPSIFRKLAPATPYAVDFFMMVFQLGTCAVYFIFIADSLHQVASIHGFHLSERLWMCLILVPILLMNLIRDLHKLAPVSTAGNFIFVLSMMVIFYYLFFYDGFAFNYISARPAIVWPLKTWPLFLGTCCYGLECISIVVIIEHKMREPRKFRQPFGVLNIGIGIIATAFAITGLCGFLKYGNKVESLVILNLTKDQILAQVVKFLYALVIFFSYPINAFVPLELLWLNYIKQHLSHYSDKRKLFLEYICREIVVVFTFLVALVVPYIGLLISLFGAFCLSVLGIIFPAIIHLLVLKEANLGFGPYNWIFIKNMALIVFGVLLMTTGTYTSLIELVKAIKK